MPEPQTASTATDAASTADHGAGKWMGRIRLASLAVGLLALLSIVRLLPMGQLTAMLAGWIESMGIWGPLLFALVYVVATVLFLPGAALTLASGAIFGLFWGTVAVSLGSTLGAACAFLIARYFARQTIEQRMAAFPKFQAVDRAVSTGGWKIVAMLRLSPAVPFNLQNYLYGLTAIGFWPCILASWLAMLPGTFMYVYLGYAGRASLAVAAGADAGRGPLQWVMLAVGLVATVAVTVYVTRLARRAIAQATNQTPEKTNMPTQTPASKPAATPATGRIRTASYAALAVAMVGLAACAHIHQQTIGGLFGPPQVVMQETHAATGSATVDHSLLDAILSEHVNANGGVNYEGLMQNPQRLLAYNRMLADVDWNNLGRDEKLALLINAYNSFTLELMVQWLAQDGIEGIRDIPAAQRWDARRWNIGGHLWSLNDIEHRQIRPHFKEPRIHWAVVCAAVGCPPLRAEAYTAEQLEAQLADQEQRVHTDGSRWLQLDRQGNAVHLTRLYDWYAGDFVQTQGGVLAYVAARVPAVQATIDRGQAAHVTWLAYDWSVNNQELLP